MKREHPAHAQTRERTETELLEELLSEAAAAFVGDATAPMVSAEKKDGVPLYKLARKGIEVERKERLIHI